jgi:eukaryotic-like serine/threonine-protein kinase
VVGSPGFMSPEQAEGGEVGPASDMFSLGAVLVFAATGVPPFGTGSTAALVYRVVHSPPRLDDMPPEVRSVAERCLAKEPSQRPTPADLLAEYEDVDLAAAWLPTRVLEGFAQPAPPADPASIDSSSRYVPTERARQPAMPDAPRTVTAVPPNRPGEPQDEAQLDSSAPISPVLVNPVAVQSGTAGRATTPPEAGDRDGGTRGRKAWLWAVGSVLPPPT